MNINLTNNINNTSEKVKRKRIDGRQLAHLLALFELNDAPSFEVREEVAAKINMTNREVQVWFQNRRAKLARKKNQDVANKLAKSNNIINNPISNNNNNPQSLPFSLGYLKQPSAFSNRSNRKTIPAPIKVNPYPNSAINSNHNSPHRPPMRGCQTAPGNYSLSPLTPTSNLSKLMHQNLTIHSPPTLKFPASATLPRGYENGYSANDGYRYQTKEQYCLSAPPNLPSLRELGLIEPKLKRGLSLDNNVPILPPISQITLHRREERNRHF